MYRCELCQTIVPAGRRSIKVVLKTRPRTYAPRGSERQERYRGFRGRRPRKTTPYDKGGVGTEIVQEAMVCQSCAEEQQAKQQAEAAAQAANAPVAVETPDAPES
ncbi:MAG: hypothetical protein DWQ34_13815 [Planctomycetota bacterium]|nr:MAG: hypothetical protein DWQ29_20210 [Planctomycetota bacterium]REJ91980.1 MAG: hypothetical protein DWQ34_13815 [Planctomycetota bacterium]REK27233.1 MAG: hypothetical protein DWQ41_07600 [Planctomycetota bacterium]REK36745.1 MAG: hypothetical protein DWQ45_09035 [Planctomycetota bacterium]